MLNIMFMTFSGLLFLSVAVIFIMIILEMSDKASHSDFRQSVITASAISGVLFGVVALILSMFL